MKRFLSAPTLFAIVLWGCTAVGGFGHAQKNEQAEVKQAGEVLTDENLQQTLVNMGYEPKKLSKGYLLAIKQDTWTLNLQIVLSGDKNKVGLNANVGKVEDPDAVTAKQWMELLVSNGNIDPSAFYFDREQKKLYLHRSFDNRAITPVILRRELENFCANIRSTGDLWKFTK